MKQVDPELATKLEDFFNATDMIMEGKEATPVFPVSTTIPALSSPTWKKTDIGYEAVGGYEPLGTNFVQVGDLNNPPSTLTTTWNPQVTSSGSGFVVKDSGQRKVFESGMQRDVTEGKTDYSLIMDGPMFERWAVHLTKGAIKYDKRNWMKASGPEELARFKESALRHFIQWYRGDRDEDHASAVFFNINGKEYVEDRLVE